MLPQLKHEELNYFNQNIFSFQGKIQTPPSYAQTKLKFLHHILIFDQDVFRNSTIRSTFQKGEDREPYN